MIHARELVSQEALRRYDDDGDPVYTTGERLLLTMRWFDWCTAEQITEALGLDEPAEMNRFQNALQYWSHIGRIERRGCEYRLVHPKQWPAQIETCKHSACKRPRAGTRVLCEHHLEIARSYRKRKYESARQAGVCVSCGIACEGARCVDCRAEQISATS